MTQLTGKTVFITGASRGIGAAAAREFARLGANVALAARSSDAVRDIAADIGTNAFACPCDVSDPDAMARAIDQAVERFGRLDVLVANAGVLEPVARIADLAPADWARVVDVNVNGVFYGVRAALDHMKGGGDILIVGSGAASSPLEGWSHYCASKAAVHQLCACIDTEYRAQGIRALVLSPGTVATQMQRVIRASGVNPVARLDWSDHIPPEWPARALVWMCSADADGFLGRVISLRDEEIRTRIGLVA